MSHIVSVRKLFQCGNVKDLFTCTRFISTIKNDDFMWDLFLYKYNMVANSSSIDGYIRSDVNEIRLWLHSRRKERRRKKIYIKASSWLLCKNSIFVGNLKLLKFRKFVFEFFAPCFNHSMALCFIWIFMNCIEYFPNGTVCTLGRFSNFRN